MIHLIGVSKEYKDDGERTIGLDCIDLEIKASEIVYIIGNSGAGKTTLLNVLSTIDRSYIGTYNLNEKDIKKMTSKELANIRNHFFGYLPQDYTLVEYDTALENIKIPLLYNKDIQEDEKNAYIQEVVQRFEMEDFIHKRVDCLSGGQRQRVALARTIINKPEVVILDEPTNALNQSLSNRIMSMIHSYVKEYNKTLIIVTHDIEKIKNDVGRVITIQNGKIEKDCLE